MLKSRCAIKLVCTRNCRIIVILRRTWSFFGLSYNARQVAGIGRVGCSFTQRNESPRLCRRPVGLSYRRRFSSISELPVIVCLSLGWRDIAQRFHQPMMVVPGYPFQGGELASRSGYHTKGWPVQVAVRKSCCSSREQKPSYSVGLGAGLCAGAWRTHSVVVNSRWTPG